MVAFKLAVVVVEAGRQVPVKTAERQIVGSAHATTLTFRCAPTSTSKDWNRLSNLRVMSVLSHRVVFEETDETFRLGVGSSVGSCPT